jgi:glycosyltransferase involved in cell wall biosynthesis
MKFRIYFSKTGLGLRKDARILRNALAHFGYEVDIVEMPSSEVRFGGARGALIKMLKAFNVLFFYRTIQDIFFRDKTTVGIHLESIFYENLYRAEHHILIPNQEWFEVSHIALLPYIKEVWVKTTFAEGVFAQYKRPVRYIGFCSVLEDYDTTAVKRRDYFFSRTGMSEYRGAENLINVWARHPEWPPLKLVIHPSRRPPIKPDNVEFLDIFPRVEDFVQFAASSLFHIYATETEGFGHSILEAMGYGSVVMVTDAPPMNEIANESCALMLTATYSGQKSIAPRFAVVPSALELAVEKAMQMDEESITIMCKSAQQRMQDFKQEFYISFNSAIKNL